MKLKQILCGIIIGSLLTSWVFAVASETLSVVPNPFEIMINGEAKEIEGYNINGNTYFKLRDIGNEVGFSVDFKEGIIMIDSGENIESAISLEDSQYNYNTIDNIEYITSTDVDAIVREIAGIKKSSTSYWSFAYSLNPDGGWTDEKGSWCYFFKMKVKDGRIKEEEKYKIPCVFIDGLPYLTRETFENEILARINAE